MGNKIIVSKHTSEFKELLKIQESEAEKLKPKHENNESSLAHLSLWEITTSESSQSVKPVSIPDKIKEKHFFFSSKNSYLLLTINKKSKSGFLPTDDHLRNSSTFSSLFASFENLTPRGIRSPYSQMHTNLFETRIFMFNGKLANARTSSVAVLKAMFLEKWLSDVRQSGVSLIFSGYFVRDNKLKSGNLINLVSHRPVSETDSKCSFKANQFFNHIFRLANDKSPNNNSSDKKLFDAIFNAPSEDTNPEESLKHSANLVVKKQKGDASSEPKQSIILSDSKSHSGENWQFPNILEQKASRNFNLNLEKIRLTDSCESDSFLGETNRKINKMEEFKNDCSNVFNNQLFLAGVSVAHNLDVLESHGIRFILNCAGDYCLNKFKDKLIYKTYFIKDSKLENIECVFHESFNFIESVISRGDKVLVHCVQGVSRSVTIVLAYLMVKLGITYTDAFDRVRKVRGIASPNIGFVVQLMNFQKRIKSSADLGTVKVFCVGSHQVEDPRTLVARFVI